MSEKAIEFDFRTIKTFEDACLKINIDPLLPDVTYMPYMPEEFKKPIQAAYKLMVIFKAINNGWTPDWNNYDQRKYFPWFEVLPSGSGFSDSYCRYSGTLTIVGSRLCSDSPEKVRYIAEQFEAEYKDFLLTE